ncbi:IclR family transcriptional regulator [Hydrogenophaga sp. BPS33]|uniref:IclR family transcriptional regulator n=1 Tax=Hydrogenophaga sp. BPS33 TaxID=2651974 RepID=UPI00131F5641|nr:IclR family transcriptional regulator [Hydrogenophaga sp. BPS33]QHE84846.1 IclR family transcriptional regulator [Hydrogenophaga sp. BPS33]
MSPDRYLRTFDILKLLAERGTPLRLTEIKQALDLPVSSLHNMLQTMVTAEVVILDDDLRYAVGPRAVSLALRTVQSLDVRTLARRPLQELAREIGDDVYLGVRIGQRVLYADRVLGTQRVSLDIRLGQPLMLHATATGKLLAAHDPQLSAKALAGKLPKSTPHTITNPQQLQKEYDHILAQGFAKSDQESYEGVVGYAVPIRGGTQKVEAAVHVSVLAGRATKAHERALLAAARTCAAQIEKLLGNEVSVAAFER